MRDPRQYAGAVAGTSGLRRASTAASRGVHAPVVLAAVAQVESASDLAERRLSIVIVALVVLAVVVAVATVIFWRATRPDVIPDPEVAMRWVPESRLDGRDGATEEEAAPAGPPENDHAPAGQPPTTPPAGPPTLGNVAHGRIQP